MLLGGNEVEEKGEEKVKDEDGVAKAHIITLPPTSPPSSHPTAGPAPAKGNEDEDIYGRQEHVLSPYWIYMPVGMLSLFIIFCALYARKSFFFWLWKQLKHLLKTISPYRVDTDMARNIIDLKANASATSLSDNNNDNNNNNNNDDDDDEEQEEGKQPENTTIMSMIDSTSTTTGALIVGEQQEEGKEPSESQKRKNKKKRGKKEKFNGRVSVLYILYSTI